MLCEICHQAEATVHIIESIEGKQTVQNLCEACAQKRHVGELLAKPVTAIHELLASLLQFDAPQTTKALGRPCPSCGQTYARFRDVGRLGCAHCYVAFQDWLLPLIRQFHQAEEHRGRGSAPPAETPGRKLEALRAALQRAVAEEQYEEAARLRDRIHRLDRAEGT